jgi:hypothetical protein
MNKKYYSFYTNIFNIAKRKQQSPKVWLKSFEIKSYFRTVIWVLRVKEYEESLNFTRNKIKFLLDKSGKKFTHLYLKECVRLLIRFLAGQGEPKFLGKGILVSRDCRGIPHIISSKIRILLKPITRDSLPYRPIREPKQDIFNFPVTSNLIGSGIKNLKLLNIRPLKGRETQASRGEDFDLRPERMLVVALLTLLCIYRLIDYKVKPDIGTIEKSFAGNIKTFPVNQALYDLLPKDTTLKLPSFRLIKLETAGPNAVKSAWSSSIDSLAFIHEPFVFLQLFLYNWQCGQQFLSWWILILIVISSPLYLVFLLFKDVKRLHLGKLAVVRDVAGKARIVAVTNWWIQAAFKPLHDGLFRILSHIEQDGTFDQEKPLNLLIERVLPGQKFYCFDLSAATDRLPLDVQRDIINVLRPGLGTTWFNIIKSMKYWFEGRYVSYSVGQTMGAYSSFAMLALTHHVIVRHAALKAGIHNFKDYAVLGDDLVIANDDVAHHYLALCENLGVEINLSKSIISDSIAEFAKKWKGSGINITPIGPGLILNASRHKIFLAPLLSELYRLELLDVKTLLILVRELPRKCGDTISLILWSVLGLGSWLQKGHRDANAILWAFPSASNTLLFQYSLYISLLEIYVTDYWENVTKLQEEAEFFYRNWWRTYSSRSWPLRTLEFILKLVGPGFWIYGFSFERSIEESLSVNPFDAYQKGDWNEIYNLGSAVVYLGQSTIDWRKQDHVRKLTNNVKRLNSYFDRTYDEASLHFS